MTVRDRNTAADIAEAAADGEVRDDDDEEDNAEGESEDDTDGEGGRGSKVTSAKTRGIKRLIQRSLPPNCVWSSVSVIRSGTGGVQAHCVYCV
jgi:hypothetical protein